LQRSNTILSSTFPAAHAGTSSFIGIPALASATDAAVIPAHLVPASAWITSMFTSTIHFGKFSNIKAGSNAPCVTLPISTPLLLGPGLFLSSTANEAILYLHFNIALSDF